MISFEVKKSKSKKRGRLISFLFQPDVAVKTFDDINLYSLVSLNIKYILCDLDNTLVPHYQIFPNESAIKFINECEKLNLKVIIISNNFKKRVKKFAELANIDKYYSSCFKPFTFKIKKILAENKINKKEVIIIGDQVITDILIGNILNIKNILVNPVFDINNQPNNLVKWLDRKIYSRLERDNLLIKKEHTSFLSDPENFCL